jgi:hypothetical protein
VDGELVEPGCHRPVALEAVDPALDGVALRVGFLVDQPALTFNAPTGFPTEQPTTGSPIVTTSPEPSRAGPDSEEGRRTDSRKAVTARRSG